VDAIILDNFEFYTFCNVSWVFNIELI